MHRKILLGAISATALAFATSASAVVWTSKLEYQGTNGPAETPYGLVTIEDGIYGKDSDLSGPANTVKVTVALTHPDSLFINTGSRDPTKSNHDPFLYNVKYAADVNVVNDMNGRDFFDGGRTDPAAFLAVPFGEFTNKIAIGDWVDGQMVVSGSHLVDQITTERVLVGYKIVGYDTKKGPIIGYDKHNRPIYGPDVPDYTKPIYDKKQPIYEDQSVTKQVKVLDYTWVDGHYVESTQNGRPGGLPGDLVFYLQDNAGLSFAGLNFTVDPNTGQLLYPLGGGNHLFSNSGGWWFTADIYDGATKETYNVAAKDAFCQECIRITEEPPPGVPEPATWALMILGFGGAGAFLRRQRRLATT